MSSEKSPKQFPIRPFRQENGTAIPQSYIPWWLAEIVYARWTIQHGMTTSLERIAEQGGFGPMVVLDLLAGGTGMEPYQAFRAMIATKTRSIKGRIPVIVPGTKEYAEAMKELASEAKEKAKAPTQQFFQNGGGLRDKK